MEQKKYLEIMAEIISKNNEKHQNKDLRSAENTKQDKYQEKKYDPDFEENFWLPGKGPALQTERKTPERPLSQARPGFPSQGNVANWFPPEPG